MINPNDCLEASAYEYAKQQLLLTPDITLFALKVLMQNGIDENKDFSPINALNFEKSLKWLEKFNSIEEVKAVLHI